MPNICGEVNIATGAIACDGFCDSGIPSTPDALDIDGDSIPDCDDNCPDDFNVDQADANSNGV